MSNLDFIKIDKQCVIRVFDTYRDAMQKLKLSKLSCLPVLDEENKYVGLLHRFDLVDNKENDTSDKFIENSAIHPYVNTSAQFDIIDENNEKWLSKLIKKQKDYKHSLIPILDCNRIFKFFAYIPSELEKTKIVSEYNANITIIGMGYVGVTLATMLAMSGYHIICIEKDEKRRKALNKGIVPFHEVGLNEIFSKLFHEGSFSIRSPDQLSKSNCIFITVGTPLLDDTKLPNVSYLEESLILAQKNLDDGGVIILRSTVPIGTTIALKQKHFDNLTTSSLFKNKHIVFCPERTLEGKALEELKSNPQIIGSESQIAREKVKKVFHRFVSKVVEVNGTNEAELVKLCDNTFRDLSFAFANSLANISMNYDVDAISVVEAANQDYPRTNIAYPSPGVGGPCLTKDPYILTYGLPTLSSALKTYLHSGRIISEMTLDGICQKVVDLYNKCHSEVILCGLAFKGDPITDDLRDSTSLILLQKLIKQVSNVKVWDPIITEKECKSVVSDAVWWYPPWISQKEKPLIIILANNSPHFMQINWKELILENKGRITLIDCWGVCEKYCSTENDNFTYLRLGKNL